MISHRSADDCSYHDFAISKDVRRIFACINSSQADLPTKHHATPSHARTDSDSRVCRAHANRSPARSFSLPSEQQKNAKQETRASGVMSLNYCESSRGNRAVGAMVWTPHLYRHQCAKVMVSKASLKRRERPYHADYNYWSRSGKTGFPNPWR